MAKLTFNAEMPDDVVGLFLQHVRDFDVIQQGCHFSIVACVGLSTDEMNRALDRVTPPFKVRKQ